MKTPRRRAYIDHAERERRADRQRSIKADPIGGCPSDRPSDRPSVRLSARPSVCPSVRLSVRPSVRLSARPSVCPSVCPSVRPSVRPFVRPSVRPRPSVRVRRSRDRSVLHIFYAVYWTKGMKGRSVSLIRSVIPVDPKAATRSAVLASSFCGCLPPCRRG